MVKTPQTNANDKPAGEKPTEAVPGQPQGSGNAPAADGATPNADTEAGAARAKDDALTGGAIRAEDNTEAGRQPDGAAEASGAGTDPSVGEKIKVETTGNFMLHDPYSLDTIEADGVSTVTKTAFTDARIAAGQLKLA